MLLPVLVERAAAVLTHPIDAAAAEMGLLPVQWRILLALHEAPDGLKVTSVANICFLLQPTATKYLDKLEEIGLLKRHLTKQDRRSIIIKLTSKGHSMALKISQKIRIIVDIELEKNCISIIEKISMSCPMKGKSFTPAKKRKIK
jgi:DNA-binding MarR family transcriptional regulator